MASKLAVAPKFVSRVKACPDHTSTVKKIWPGPMCLLTALFRINGGVIRFKWKKNVGSMGDATWCTSHYFQKPPIGKRQVAWKMLHVSCFGPFLLGFSGWRVGLATTQMLASLIPRHASVGVRRSLHLINQKNMGSKLRQLKPAFFHNQKASENTLLASYS